MTVFASRLIISALVAVLLHPLRAGAQDPTDPLGAVGHAIAAAEASLQVGELEMAESHYRAALFDGLMTLGNLHAAAGRLPDARDAFEQASRASVAARPAFHSLALVHIQMGRADEAVRMLTQLAGRARGDLDTRRLLARALAANGQSAEAVQELEEAHAAAPDDPEIAFLLASGYLQAGKVEAVEPLFARVAAARPIPQTWVLIGRTYRDFGEYDRARAALKTALKQDPRTRRAHYYLGTIAVLADGVVGLDAAIGEFQTELTLAPEDEPTNLRLGMALVEARRETEALPALEIAVRAAPSALALLYLGRCQLALGHGSEALTSLRRALALAQTPGGGDPAIRQIHYQLALALRQSGAQAEAATHFAAAKEGSSRRAEANREELNRYMADSTEPAALASPALDSPFAALEEPARADLERRARAALARAYLNLGVMRAQANQFVRAVEFLGPAVALDPDFPKLQYSLGVARFNAQQYDKAVAPLARALTSEPDNADLRRMLALAQFNAGAYEEAGRLLATDPSRESDPSLQYIYGLALVRSDRAAEAEAVFTRLLAEHGDRAELHVILGQAHAQQGNFEAAEAALDRARQLDPEVADANAALGLMYLKQGKLAEAAAALRAELKTNPGNLPARHTLATVLDLEGHTGEALTLLRGVLAEQPGFGDARYLLGKILVTQGAAAEAVPHLEAAVRLSPENATYHYQLAQAYLKTGQRELADRHLGVFRDLKDKNRGRTP